MLKERMMPRDKRGFTLTEAAIVLGIVGLILGAIWVAAAAVYNNLRVSTTSNQLLQIVQSVRSMHATQNTVGAIDAVNVAKAGGIPKDMLDNPTNPTTVRDVWGGNVTIAAATSVVANDSFTITFARVPQSACMDLYVRNTGPGRDSGLTLAGALAVAAFPIDLTEALGQCGVVAAAGNNVSFSFTLKT